MGPPLLAVIVFYCAHTSAPLARPKDLVTRRPQAYPAILGQSSQSPQTAFHQFRTGAQGVLPMMIAVLLPATEANLPQVQEGSTASEKAPPATGGFRRGERICRPFDAFGFER